MQTRISNSKKVLNFRTISIFFILFLFILKPALHAQKADSLQLLLSTTKSSKQKLILLKQLSEELEKTDLNKALQYNNLAIELATSEKVDSLLPELHNRAGTFYFALGLYKQAIEKFTIVFNLYSQQQNYDKIAITYPNIGAVYLKFGDLDKANEVFLKSKEYLVNNRTKFSETRYNEVFLMLLNNLGNIQNQKNNQRKAINYYTEALILAEDIKSVETQASLCHNLGKVYIELQAFDSAQLFLNRAIKHRRVVRNLNGISMTLVLLSELYFQINKIDSAILFANEALKCSEQINSIESQLQSTRILVKLFENKKDFSKAFEMQNRAIALNDSIYSIKKANEIYKIQLENELNVQKLEFEIVRKQKENRNLIIFLSLVIIIASLIIFYIIQQNRLKKLKLNRQILELNKKQLEAEIEIKNKELTTQVIYLIQKNEILSDIINRIMELKEVLKSENKPIIQKIINDLGTLLNKNIWEEFEIRFQNVHTEFYEKLQTKFSELTPNERKLCAFLRLNMTTKEISAITKQTAKSIDIARHRLRKKLNLTNTQVSLVSYLMEL